MPKYQKDEIRPVWAISVCDNPIRTPTRRMQSLRPLGDLDPQGERISPQKRLGRPFMVEVMD